MKTLSRILFLSLVMLCVYFVVDSTTKDVKQNIAKEKNTNTEISNVERNIEKENLELKMQFLACKAHQ